MIQLGLQIVVLSAESLLLRDDVTMLPCALSSCLTLWCMNIGHFIHRILVLVHFEVCAHNNLFRRLWICCDSVLCTCLNTCMTHPQRLKVFGPGHEAHEVLEVCSSTPVVWHEGCSRSRDDRQAAWRNQHSLVVCFFGLKQSSNSGGTLRCVHVSSVARAGVVNMYLDFPPRGKRR